MRLPVVHGLIRRRLLINFRVAPHVLAELLPAPFRPRLVNGVGLAGICLIRLEQLRPAGLPRWLGIASENGAHRAAVEWDDRGTTRQGVFIWRRDTNAWLTVAAGGRVFPGVHHHAGFHTEDDGERVALRLRSDDGQVQIDVCGRHSDHWPAGSAFASEAEASAFLRDGSLGYSPNASGTELQGMQLDCDCWPAEALEITDVRSSFFDDPWRFPTGAVEYDSSLVMRNVRHRWRLGPPLAGGERRACSVACEPHEAHAFKQKGSKRRGTALRESPWARVLSGGLRGRYRPRQRASP